MKTVDEPFPSVYTTQVFPQLMSLILNVKEDTLLQNGTETLKLLVHRDFKGIASWTDGKTQGFHLIVQFIAKLLDPSLNESSAIYGGDLVTKLIQMGGQDLAHILPEILNGVIIRLEVATMPSFVQSLVLIFCNLIHSQLQVIVDFLATTTVNNKSGLDIFIKAWCSSFGEFQGYCSVKSSTVAMAELYACSAHQLQSIVLQGDLVIPVSTSSIL